MTQIQTGQETKLFIFARFHARDGMEGAIEDVMREMLGPVREEKGCLAIEVFRSTRDPKLFYVHSSWVDEAAFDLHGALPHTRRFIDQVEPLIDHELVVTRARPIG